MLDALATNDLIRIANAGGGFTIHANRRVDDLIRIANAASSKGTRVRMLGAAALAVNDLIRIGNAGGGAVEFA